MTIWLGPRILLPVVVGVVRLAGPQIALQRAVVTVLPTLTVASIGAGGVKG